MEGHSQIRDERPSKQNRTDADPPVELEPSRSLPLLEVVRVTNTYDWPGGPSAGSGAGRDRGGPGAEASPSGVSERELTTAEDQDALADLLDLLADEEAQQILEALRDTRRPARELLSVCDGSRATIYRRLERLQERDLVSVSREIHPDGHHRKVFEARLEDATVHLDDGVITVGLRVRDPSGGTGTTTAHSLAE